MLGLRINLSILLLLALTTAGFSAPAGKAVGVLPVARIVTGSKQGKLAVGQDIFMGDKIATSAFGQVQIEFNDKTRLVIGPSSRLVISKYVTGDSSRVKSFAVRATAGAFRFISGNSAKPNYLITTPTGTIGIRGTGFDFGVRSAGRTYVILFSGVARLCGTAGSCRSLNDLCEIAGTNSRGDARLASESDFLPRRGDLRRSFPFVRSQGSLRLQFRISAATSCRDAVNSPNGIDTGGGGDSDSRGKSDSNR